MWIRKTIDAMIFVAVNLQKNVLLNAFTNHNYGEQYRKSATSFETQKYVIVYQLYLRCIIKTNSHYRTLIKAIHT